MQKRHVSWTLRINVQLSVGPLPPICVPCKIFVGRYVFVTCTEFKLEGHSTIFNGFPRIGFLTILLSHGRMYYAWKLINDFLRN